MSLPVLKVCNKRLKCYSAKSIEFCISFIIYYFISCLFSIVILSICIFLFLFSFLSRYMQNEDSLQDREKCVQLLCKITKWSSKTVYIMGFNLLYLAVVFTTFELYLYSEVGRSATCSAMRISATYATRKIAADVRFDPLSAYCGIALAH